ncbi:MAG: hypothetical protein K2N38_09805 [Oscillospiraceae bacterium]|nr:hypothetical protein [Oscillospiraceae bacterium]
MTDIEACLSGTETAKDGAAVTLTFTATGNGNGARWAVTGGGGTLPTNLANADLAKYGITLDGAAADGDTIEITYTPATSDVPAKTGVMDDAAGTVKFGINVDAYNVADLSKIAVHSVPTPKAATMASQVATPGVSQANSFKNSTGVLTYTDNLTLQTGARTKDSVNFAFSYNTDGTADMGNLVSNLDLSSRSTGLNTASLSLANQDDANYAIDQIDKAINKTSMVRATFGSIQNRLEHKITNLTTTAENLTEAESSIRDTDMASEMMNYTKFNILQQAAQSMLAQANQQPQSILQLLG